MDSDEESTKEKRKHIVIKNSTDLQRMKLEKLMKNPDKPVLIPERPKPRGVPAVPDFVRNVMGSSAGAGSGEFHVYRHLRRKEYARQKYMQEKGERERLDEEYHKKLEEHRRIAEEKTAKKRAKRLKRKDKSKNKKKKPKLEKKSSDSESASEPTSEEECEEVNSALNDAPSEDHEMKDDIKETVTKKEIDIDQPNISPSKDSEQTPPEEQKNENDIGIDKHEKHNDRVNEDTSKVATSSIDEDN